MSKEYIERGALYRKVAELEMLARDRYLDTPTNSPVYPRYMAQLGERTQLKFLIADFPAADVVVLPCKPGDTIYRIVRWGKRNVDIRERIVSSVEYNVAGEWVVHSTGDDVLGTNCFLTREEAERALGGAKMDGECREG